MHSSISASKASQAKAEVGPGQLQWPLGLGKWGGEQPRDRRVENGRKAQCHPCGCQAMVGLGTTCCSPHTGYMEEGVIAQDAQRKVGVLNLLLKCGNRVP